jgi:xanthine/CO dehydrogenase XdhC/CoxF family maturation factor
MLDQRKKLDRMLTEWEEEGLRFTSEQLSVIHSPVGLNIGAETAEEIALSILAEIKAVLSGKQGQFLKTDDNTIHARQATLIEEKRID